MSINGSETLILRTDGTFDAFLGGCQLQVGGSWLESSTGSKLRSRERRSLIDFCSLARKLCDKTLSSLFAKLDAETLCDTVGSRIGAEIGGGVGSLGTFSDPKLAYLPRSAVWSLDDN